MNEPEQILTIWHHAPAHVFTCGTFYMITAGTYNKELLFNTTDKLDFLQNALFIEAEKHHWNLQAWALFSNHYHVIAGASSEGKNDLSNLIRSLHSKTAIWLNQQDHTPGRRVWYEYWDSCLTYEKSYLARLHYVHMTPVKHQVAVTAKQYRWCSMPWFLQRAKPSFCKTVLSFKIDQLNIRDDF